MLENIEKWAGSSPEAMKHYAENVPPDLIEGLIPSQAVVTFAGAPGIGKSYIALSWAAAIASGTPWHEHAVLPVPQRVVYVLGEGFSRFGRRIQAWEDAHGMTLPSNLQFIDGAGNGINLLDENDVEGAIQALRRLEYDPEGNVFPPLRPGEARWNVNPALIIIDTFSMLARVKSENDESEVKEVFHSAHRIVRELGSTVMLMHHTNKQSGQVRGSTVFRGNADTVVMAIASTSGRVPKIRLSTQISDDGKQRDGDPVSLSGFRIASPGVLTRDESNAEEHIDTGRAMMQAADESTDVEESSDVAA